MLYRTKQTVYATWRQLQAPLQGWCMSAVGNLKGLHRVDIVWTLNGWKMSALLLAPSGPNSSEPQGMVICMIQHYQHLRSHQNM
jgi:hypothetical protein